MSLLGEPLMKKYLLTTFALAVILVSLNFKYCDKSEIQIDKIIKTSGKVVFKNVINRASKKAKTAGSPRSQTSRPYVPPEGYIEIKPKDHTKNLKDLILVKIKDRGFTRKLGFQASYPSGFGLDYKLVFYKRFGGSIGGLYFPQKKKADFSTSLSYRLDRLPAFDNLEVMVGYAPITSTKFVGIRINL